MRNGKQLGQIAQAVRANLERYLDGARLISNASHSHGPGCVSGCEHKAPAAATGSKAPGSMVQTRSNAQAVAMGQRVEVVPDIKIDLFGAVSVVSPEETVQEGVYKNQDGHRFEDGRYARFMEEISSFIPTARQFTDPVRTFAYGTDASFYRLNPKLVVKVHNEEEVRRILPIAHKHGVPVTFRAAGTSLSGQAVTDSVLLKLSHTGKNFRNYKVHGDGSMVTVEPGLIAGEVNRILAAHQKKGKHPIQYKIGPDPSSVDSCMIGGVVANNSSGMCCGVSQNTYHTAKDMRIVFVDGTVLDTADPVSRQSFLAK